MPIPLAALASQASTVASPFTTAVQPVTAGVTQGKAAGAAAQQVAPHLRGEDGERLDPYTTGIIAGISQTGFTGKDPLYSFTENIERFGGPGLGFGATGPLGIPGCGLEAPAHLRPRHAVRGRGVQRPRRPGHGASGRAPTHPRVWLGPPSTQHRLCVRPVDAPNADPGAGHFPRRGR